jgi:hypothetical protein
MKNKKATALIVLAFVATLSLLSLTPATTLNPTAFTPNDQFTIPERNGIIRFGLAETTVCAQNGSWIFKTSRWSTLKFLGLILWFTEQRTKFSAGTPTLQYGLA